MRFYTYFKKYMKYLGWDVIQNDKILIIIIIIIIMIIIMLFASAQTVKPHLTPDAQPKLTYISNENVNTR